jgi:hypothetical protein
MRFHKLVEYLTTPLGKSMLGIGRGSADFAHLVHEAQKFYVGDVCVLEGIRLGIASAKEYPRLPFPMCVFEFQDEDPRGVSRPFFLLTEELGDSQPGIDRVRIHSFVPYPMPKNEDDLWIHNGWIEIDRATNTYDAWANKNTLKFLAAGEGFKQLADSASLETSMRSSAEWLWSFLTVLNCSNVHSVEVDAPVALNIKRLGKGRPPLYSYKTLVLTQRQKRISETPYGSHASPRIHLRRGHIKRRASGNFWWQPCVVGSRERGIVVKDYHAAKLASSATR